MCIITPTTRMLLQGIGNQDDERLVISELLAACLSFSPEVRRTTPKSALTCNHLETLDSVEVVRIIREALKR